MKKKKQLGYIGHLARYSSRRVERKVIGIVIAASWRQSKKRSRCLRDAYWTRVVEVVTVFGRSEMEAPHDWLDVARDAKKWAYGSKLAVEKYRRKNDLGTWHRRHHGPHSAVDSQATVSLQTLDGQGRAQCSRCRGWFSTREFISARA